MTAGNNLSFTSYESYPRKLQLIIQFNVSLSECTSYLVHQGSRYMRSLHIQGTYIPIRRKISKQTNKISFLTVMCTRKETNKMMGKISVDQQMERSRKAPCRKYYWRSHLSGVEWDMKMSLRKSGLLKRTVNVKFRASDEFGIFEK